MSPRVRRLTSALGALLAACVTLTSAFAGSAAATPYNGVPNGITSITLTKNSADMKRVAEYWNPAKLKQVMNNVPASPEMKSSGTSSSAAPTPTATAASATDTTAAITAPTSSGTSSQLIKPTLPKKRPPATGTSPVTVGKVFFRIGDKDFWCSASSVASANRDLVATAAHCAYDAKQGKAASYWIFIPGYNKGMTPYGIYVGHSLNLHESFVGRGDYDYDYAFVTVHDGFVWKPGKTAGTYEMQTVGSLEDNVGGQGLAVNRGVRLYTLAFGYPAAPHIDGSRPYDGQQLKSCDGLTTRQQAPTRLVEEGIALKCGFTAGASGGPWLIGYDTKHAVGYLNGVNSFTWDTNTDRIYDQISSPYFKMSTFTVYRWAASQRVS